MDLPIKVVNGKLICLKQNHNDPVEKIVMNQQVPLYDRLLCQRCLKQKQQVPQHISLEEARDLIEKKLYKLNDQQEEQKKEVLKDLNEFSNIMMNIKSRVIQQIDEILRISQQWTTNLMKMGQKPVANNFIDDLQLLSQYGNDQYFYKDCNKSHLKQICLSLKSLTNTYNFVNCYNIMKSILRIRVDEQKDQYQKIIQKQNQTNLINVKKVQLIQSTKQERWSYAIAFNNSGTVMVSGCDKNIIIWDFEYGNMKYKEHLKGHENDVLCLVFSKKHNWFASGGKDCTIICWKENLDRRYRYEASKWVSTKPYFHCNYVTCLILNNKEDQLISCIRDSEIAICTVNCELNLVEYDYNLENNYTNGTCCININESETALVSCRYDKKIILWSKDQNSRWKYKHQLTMDDIGYRICFISERRIIWQQSSKGITHLLEYQQGKLIKRPDLNIHLNQENKDYDLFRTIRNKNKNIIIQKHNRCVYILQQQANGQLSVVSEPIDCCSSGNYGALTESGEYLVIWNAETTEYKVYNIKYE